MASASARQHGDVAMVLRTVDGEIVSWSPAMERRYGIPREAAIGQHAHILLGTVFPTFTADIRQAFQLHGTWRGGILTHRGDGTPLLTVSQWYRHGNGAAAGDRVVEIHGDTIGVLDDDDGRLAHDLITVINTILVETISAASIYAATGRRLLETSPEARHGRLAEICEGVRHEIRRNETGTRLLKDFGRELEGTLKRRGKR